MDFFREQEIARRNSRLLTLLFIIAVLVLILLTNVVIAGAFFFQDSTSAGTTQSLGGLLQGIDWQVFWTVGGGIALVIITVVLFNWLRFSQGGKTVAEALGGRAAVTATNDPFERRAQNIVQEIALAANMPVPPLYILDDERGVNAFAAGVRPADAVIGVTRGAMVQLTRDELQGVIAHEFSHILNGDMRLSIRLAAMLRGITFIGDIGSALLRGAAFSGHRHRGKSDNAAAGLAIGLSLFVIGLIGGLMAGLIKSAISKQKEYLADASAVQFTRNPDGIGDALKVIGGYTPGTLVHTARAEELSHLFFGQVKHRLWSLFATHPPLTKRIQRVDPAWDGQFIKRSTHHRHLEPNLAEEMGLNQAARAMAAAGIAAGIDYEPLLRASANHSATTWGEPLITRPPELGATVIDDANEPLGAMSLLLALLWHPQQDSKQMQCVCEANIRGLEGMVAQRGRELSGLAPELRLPLIELCLPALKTLSVEQYTAFKGLLLSFIRADEQIDLFEWCLFQLVRHYLDPEFMQVKPAKPLYKNLSIVPAELSIALGTLAYLGQHDTEDAFRKGSQVIGLALALPPSEQCDIQAFSRAIDRLANCYPLPKVTLLKAMAEIARHDGEICPRELSLLKAIAAVIDCPLPNSALADITA